MVMSSRPLVALCLLGSAAGLRVTPARSRVLSADAVARRSALAAASSAVLLGCASALPGGGAALAAVKAPKRDEAQLKRVTVLILRVMEATDQEERLIKSGMYKDVQRKSVKNAATMMLDNYDLRNSLVTASIFVDAAQVAEATRLGQEASEALTQIVGYFPADLSVGELERPQQDFVLKALATTRVNLESFVAMLPQDVVRAARSQIAEENQLNVKEFKELYPGEAMINVPTPGATTGPQIQYIPSGSLPSK